MSKRAVLVLLSLVLSAIPLTADKKKVRVPGGCMTVIVPSGCYTREHHGRVEVHCADGVSTFRCEPDREGRKKGGKNAPQITPTRVAITVTYN